MAEHGELLDKSEHVYTASLYKSSQTAFDYNFAKTEQQSRRSAHVALLGNDHTEPIQHSTLQKSTFKIHTRSV